MINHTCQTIPSRLTFPKANRLVARSEFQAVFNQGKRLHGYAVCVYYHANVSQKLRLGIVISKRVMPLAVDRNAYKRLIKESFRLVQNRTGCAGLDLVVLVKKVPDSKLPVKEKLKSDLQRLWSRLR